MDEQARKRKGAIYGFLLGALAPAMTLALFGTATMGADYYARKGFGAVGPTFFYQLIVFAFMYGLFGGIIWALVGWAVASHKPKH